MNIKYILILIVLLLFAVLVAQSMLFSPNKRKGQYITLKEVIPEAQIVSESEGVIKYCGMKIILGQSDFKRKRELIEILHLERLSGISEIDMRFRKQIILRKNLSKNE